MYATCVYCHGALGANEVVEHFPVGRKLAFDAARGRLWAVCPRCTRRNLSPLEERWEAIETCERLYRDTPLKASTDNIGLAKLSEGLQLVRVGQPTRPEFAAWRYGGELQRRRIRTWAIYGGSAALMIGLTGLKWINPSLHGAIPLAGVIPGALNYWNLYRLHLKRVARVPYRNELVTLRRSDIGNVKLEAVSAGADEAKRLMGKLLTVTNEEGGSADTVRSAVTRLAEAGSADAFIQQYIRTGKGVFSGSWKEGTRDQHLALEMALHEDTERAALEGDLAALERAWAEAEEIAAIADNLLLPAWIQQRLPDATTRRRPADGADSDRGR
jgi:hypothetical protein